MREVLTAAVQSEPDMEAVGEADSGEQALELATELRPDVILMDLIMPGKHGLEAIAEITARAPEVHIIAFTGSTEQHHVAAAFEAGALGYVLKDVHRAELLQSVREVARGNTYISPSVTALLVDYMRFEAHSRNAAPSEPLSEREQEVLALLGEGEGNRRIAQLLEIREGTVRTHIRNILQKLQLENRSQAVVYAVQKGVKRP